MIHRALIILALLSSALTAGAGAQSTVSDSSAAIGPARPELFTRVIANQKRAEAALELYERVERVETRKSSSDPSPPSIKITRVIPSGTGMVKIPMGPDATPGGSAAYRSSLENLARALALLANDGGSPRDALEKYAKKKKERNDLMADTHNAFLFTFVGNETRDDRLLAKFEMDPRP